MTSVLLTYSQNDITFSDKSVPAGLQRWLFCVCSVSVSYCPHADLSNTSVILRFRTLFKYVKKFEAALNAPSRPALMEEGDDRSLDCVDQPQEETPVQRLNRAVKSVLTAKGKATQVLRERKQLALELNAGQAH